MICLLRIPVPQSVAGRTRAGHETCKLLDLATDIAMRLPAPPPLYEAGVRFIPQRPGVQDFRLPLDTYRSGGGDCKMLVVWRLAELRRAGERATPNIIWKRVPGGWQAHARVRRADGTVEDPSIELGMGASRRRPR